MSDDPAKRPDRARFSIMPSRAFHDQTLTYLDILVLGVIGYHLNEDNLAWPLQKTIAEALGKTREAVNRSIKRLVEADYVTVYKRRRGDGAQASSVYLVHLDPKPLTQDVVESLVNEAEKHKGEEQSDPRITLQDDENASIENVDENNPQGLGITSNRVIPEDHRGCDPYDHSIRNSFSELPIEESKRCESRAEGGSAGSVRRSAEPTEPPADVEKRIKTLRTQIGALDGGAVPYRFRNLDREALDKAMPAYRAELASELENLKKAKASA